MSEWPLRFVAVGGAAGALTLTICLLSRSVIVAADVPDRLSDREFWSLTQTLSEPGGSFQSDNLISDEMIFASVVPDLRRTIRAGGVYLGVGPEQNFTYIAAIKPRLAFVIDIRRGNLDLQLMYKALFELSADRAEFMSRLFTKPKPAGLRPNVTAADLMDAYWNVKTADVTAYERNLQDITEVLVRKHGFAMTKENLDGIAYAYHAFYWYGPSIRWSSGPAGSSVDRSSPTYVDLMRQKDVSGSELSYLASDAAFAVVKELQSKNAVVPVTGDFAGPKSLRAIGAYLRGHQAAVSVFYLDEVEPYLRQNKVWSVFCGNAATLPIDNASVFIRPPESGVSGGFFSPTSGEQVLFPIGADVRTCGSGR